MKIFLIHNFYQSHAPSGEDLTYLSEKKLLLQHGHEIITYERRNDEIKKFRIFERLVMGYELKWARKTYEEVKTIAKRERPDVAHIHNIFYLITPSVYDALKEIGVPIVQRLPNFRLLCANGLLFMNGRICEECLESGPWRATLHGCFRNSRSYSLPISRMLRYHWKHDTWNRKIDVFVPPSEFVRGVYIKGGIRDDKIFVKPNFVDAPSKLSFEAGQYGLFLGRLSPEKGVFTMLDAWSDVDKFPLKIVGDGEIREKLEQHVRKRLIKNVSFLGQKSFGESREFISHARFLVMPSECYETFGKGIIEAYSYGKPVVVANLGGMAELVLDGETGFLFKPGNASDLALKAKRLIDNPRDAVKMGKNARREFENKYTAEINYKILMNIYHHAMDNCKR